MAKQHTPSDSSAPIRLLVQNRKARHEYEVLETWEAGIVLRGTEVKSLRAGGGSIVDSYVMVDKNEVWLYHFHIAPYDKGNRHNVESRRTRKLLLNKREIKKINGALTEKGLAVIPLRMYLKGQFVKLQLGLCRGKKTYDKRQDMREKDSRREMDRARKHHHR